jgi:hypothetical protein
VVLVVVQEMVVIIILQAPTTIQTLLVLLGEMVLELQILDLLLQEVVEEEQVQLLGRTLQQQQEVLVQLEDRILGKLEQHPFMVAEAEALVYRQEVKAALAVED